MFHFQQLVQLAHAVIKFGGVFLYGNQFAQPFHLVAFFRGHLLHLAESETFYLSRSKVQQVPKNAKLHERFWVAALLPSNCDCESVCGRIRKFVGDGAVKRARGSISANPIALTQESTMTNPEVTASEQKLEEVLTNLKSTHEPEQKKALLKEMRILMAELDKLVFNHTRSGKP
jgi:hypothetical protein